MIETALERDLRELWGDFSRDGQFAFGLYLGFNIHINTDYLGEKGVKIAASRVGDPNPTIIVQHSDLSAASRDLSAASREMKARIKRWVK